MRLTTTAKKTNKLEIFSFFSLPIRKKMERRMSLRLKEKRRKIEVKKEEPLNDVDFFKRLIAVRSEQQINPFPYLNLVDDCWEYIFDFLSVDDILNLSETCKKMQVSCGNYIVRYIPNIAFDLVKTRLSVPMNGTRVLRTDFLPFVSVLEIDQYSVNNAFTNDETRVLLNNITNFPQLKTLKICNLRGMGVDVGILRILLRKIENLELRDVLFSNFDHFYLESHCENLKSLSLSYCADDDDIFLESFPKLEYFKYIGYRFFLFKEKILCYLDF